MLHVLLTSSLPRAAVFPVANETQHSPCISVKHIWDIERKCLILNESIVPGNNVNIHVICSDCFADPRLSYKRIRACVNHIDGSALASSRRAVTFIKSNMIYTSTQTSICPSTQNSTQSPTSLRPTTFSTACPLIQQIPR